MTQQNHMDEDNLVKSRPDRIAKKMDCMKHLTDDDFKCSAAQFDLDYLENISSDTFANANELSRKSLFVKFDPLVNSGTMPGATKSSMTSARLAEINERENDFSPSDKPKKSTATVSFVSDLLVMDTPPKRERDQICGADPKNSELASWTSSSAVLIADTDMTAMAQSTSKKMYTEDQVAEMVEAVEKEEVEAAAKKYGPEIAALEEELASLEEKPVQELSLVDCLITSEQNLLAEELHKWKLLTMEHERLESLIANHHDKLKEKFLTLAEKRDSTLKSEKIKVKSFEDLRRRYLNLQNGTMKLYKAQGSLSSLKASMEKANENLKRISEECLLKQDHLNLSHESLLKDLMSRIAAEQAQTKTTGLQVTSMERDLQQKENEKQQMTQIAEELMKGLRSSDN